MVLQLKNRLKAILNLVIFNYNPFK